MHNKTSHQSACWCAMNSRLLGLGLALCSPSLLASDIMLYVQQQANHVNLVLHPLPSATETCASPVELTQALTIEQSTLHYSVQGCQHGQQVVYDGASKLRMSLLQWLEQAAQQPNVNVGLAVQTAQGIQQRIAIAPLTATQRLQLARQIVDWQVAGEATAFADSAVLSLQKMASQCVPQGQTTGFSVGLQTALNQQHLKQDSEQLQRNWQQAWHQFNQPSSSATWYATAPSILQGIAQAMMARQVGYSFHFNASSLLGLWTGNVNRYRYTAAGWSHILPNGRLNMQATGEWGNAQQGMLAQLPVGDRRVILSNRGVQGVALSPLKPADLRMSQDEQRFALLNLFGYHINADGSTAQQPQALQQRMGANLHSTPVLVTQSYYGTQAEQQANQRANQRDDYVLFGTMQGLLHIVDMNGKEIAAFLPNEMVERQANAFYLDDEHITHAQFYYGLDGAWMLHSQYQRDTQGAFHVRTAQQLSRQDNRQGHLTQHAMQWAYGGLRMGGRSYYALDLSQFSAQQPHRIQLQFHIDPERESVHHAQGSTHYPQLRHMGQSWSKPTVGYVYWQGKRRLVMAVGGGYDTGYEQSNYHQTNQQGAGIYLFDAMTGELLWWASANHRQSTSADVIAATDGDVHHLKYSVVSPIQAIDSNQDGVWDRLYFADLAGQAFRVQLSQSHQAQRPFTAMVQRILNEYRADGLSPRFYHAPSVSAHSNAQGQFLAVAWSSGDYSSLWAKSPVTAHDGVYVLHEPLAKGAISQNDTQALMPLQQLSEQNQSSSRGWFYRYASVAGEVKGIASPYVRQNRLYIPVYRQATASCEPTLGQSELLQLCMPWGVCGGLNATTLPALLPQQVQRITLGQGIWPLQWAMATHEQRLSISQQNGKNANAEFCKTPAGLGHAACLQLQPMAQLRILKWSQANGL